MEERQAIERAIKYFEKLDLQLLNAEYPGILKDEKVFKRFKGFFLLNITVFFLGLPEIFDTEDQAINYHTFIVEATEELEDLIAKREKLTTKINDLSLGIYRKTIDRLENPNLPLFRKIFEKDKSLMQEIEQEINKRLEEKERLQKEKEKSRKAKEDSQKKIDELGFDNNNQN